VSAMMVIEQFISLGKARQSMNLRPMASSTIAATPPVRHPRFYGRGRRAATKSPTGARGSVASHCRVDGPTGSGAAEFEP
jgi:hypothetical protein